MYTKVIKYIKSYFPPLNNKGFTLIELLIVIGIIGILTTVGLPVYRGSIRDAKNAVAQSTASAIHNYITTERAKFETTKIDATKFSEQIKIKGKFIPKKCITVIVDNSVTANTNFSSGTKQDTIQTHTAKWCVGLNYNATDCKLIKENQGICTDSTGKVTRGDGIKDAQCAANVCTTNEGVEVEASQEDE